MKVSEAKFLLERGYTKMEIDQMSEDNARDIIYLLEDGYGKQEIDEMELE